MNSKKLYLPLIALLPAVGLVGCGGSGGTDGGTSGNRTIGIVSSVSANSVTVGNTTFDTTNTTVSGDEINSLDQLKPGMIVKVDGSVNDAANTGKARDIDYDAEVEGRVDSIGGGMMVVMGQNIDISQSPTFVSKMMGISDINNIPAGAMVEVSGYSDNMGNIVATYVELEDHMADSDDSMEVEGVITNLQSDNFMIGNQVIYFDASKINLTLQEGMNVEVDVVMDNTGTLHAVEIEIEDDFGHDGDHDVEIEGPVTSGLANGEFSIMGHACRLAANVRFEGGLTEASIVEGAVLEVEGYLEDGVLVVTEVGDEEESEDHSSDDSSSSSDSSNSSVDTTPSV